MLQSFWRWLGDNCSITENHENKNLLEFRYPNNSKQGSPTWSLVCALAMSKKGLSVKKLVKTRARREMKRWSLTILKGLHHLWGEDRIYIPETLNLVTKLMINGTEDCIWWPVLVFMQSCMSLIPDSILFRLPSENGKEIWWIWWRQGYHNVPQFRTKYEDGVGGICLLLVSKDQS